MRAARIHQYGSSSVLRIEEVPTPGVMPNQVLIRVHAAGINPSDWRLRKGEFRLIPTSFPKILGSECAGFVEQVGELVNSVQPGDRVVALLGHRGGGYADYAVTDENRVVRLPDEVSFVDAASVPVTGVTALQALRDLGHTRPNDRVLINGASGGVGVMAVQIARMLDSHVTAVCSAGNANLVRQLGARHVIDYQTTDFTDLAGQLYRSGEPAGLYQVVFDVIGNRTFGECRRILSSRGIYVSPVPSPGLFLQSIRTLLAAQRARFVGAKDRVDDLHWLIEHLRLGGLKAVIDRMYPLEAVAQAHDYSESGRVRGKLVLQLS